MSTSSSAHDNPNGMCMLTIHAGERLVYMKSVNAVKGATRVVDRNNIYEDVIDIYRSGDIVGECPIHIKYSGEEAIDYGGVQRDMYSAFWEEVYKIF